MYMYVCIYKTTQSPFAYTYIFVKSFRKTQEAYEALTKN